MGVHLDLGYFRLGSLILLSSFRDRENKGTDPYVFTPQKKELVFSCYLKKSHGSFRKINHPVFYTSKLLGIAWEIICSTLESSKS